MDVVESLGALVRSIVTRRAAAARTGPGGPVARTSRADPAARTTPRGSFGPPAAVAAPVSGGTRADVAGTEPRPAPSAGTVAAANRQPAPATAEAGFVSGLFANPRSLAAAFVVAEILAQPVALRER